MAQSTPPPGAYTGGGAGAGLGEEEQVGKRSKWKKRKMLEEKSRADGSRVTGVCRSRGANEVQV